MPRVTHGQQECNVMKRCRVLAIVVWMAATCAGADDALLTELGVSPHRILFEAYAGDNWELFVMNADGSAKRNLTQTPAIHELYPQASRDGTMIAFLADVVKDGKTVRSVYYMNADGTGRTLVAEAARQPCWSPDGTRIAFVKQEFRRFQIKDFASKGLYFYDLATGETTPHPNETIHHLYTPAWSPDSRWIVSTVHAGMGYGHGILAIEVAGMEASVRGRPDGVHNLRIPGCRPCLSPDGKRVTWSPDDHTVKVADIDLMLAEPTVSHVRTVAKHETLHLYHPDFSPDGKYITFSMGPGGRVQPNGPGTHAEVAEMVGVRGPWDLYLKRADGAGEAVQLTDDATMSNKESDWLPAVDVPGNRP